MLTKEKNLLEIEHILQIACDTIKDFFEEQVLLVDVLLLDFENPSKCRFTSASQDKSCNLEIQNYASLVHENLEDSAYYESINHQKKILEDTSLSLYPESSHLANKGIKFRTLLPLFNPMSKEVFGCLNIYSTDRDLIKLGEKGSKDVDEIIFQLAATIENERNHFLEKRNTSRSVLVNKLFYEINKSQDIDEIVTKAINKLGEIMHCSRCMFAGITLDSWLVQAEYKDSDLEKSILGLSGDINEVSGLIEGSQENGYFVVDDISLIKKSSPNLFKLYQETDVKSLIYLPIKMREKVCGILGLSQTDHHRDWTQEEIELLEIVRDQISASITQAQLINDLKANNERLLELDRLKSQLMSTVSHELRTPLTNILGFSELLLSKDFDREASKGYLEEIHGSSKRLSDLIKDFLDLARIEATGQIPLNPFEDMELDWIAENAWKDADDHNHQIKWEIEKNLPHLEGDADAIRRVFTNLFSNAIKYSPDNKTIKCKISRGKDGLLVCVEDKGMGIAPDMLESVFQRFFRVDNSDTRNIGGTGLGLAICEEIIRSHQGEIWCESKLDKGAKFFFSLPLRQH